MNEGKVTIERRGHVLLIGLDRVPKRNAFDVAMYHDLATATTRFAQIEIKRGIYPVGGATVRLIQEVGWGNAMRYLLTGDEFSAADALRIGLVQEVVEPGRQTARAIEIAETIAAQAPLGVQATLASARLTRAQGEAAAFARLLPDLMSLMSSEDVKEGLQSFIDRRPGKFIGR